MIHHQNAPQAARWLASRCSGTLRSDSRQVQPGDAFIAWPGFAHDGRAFVGAALAAGAAACLVEAQGAQAFGFDDERVAALPGLKAGAGLVADAWFGAPSASVDIVAVTGTNGKTSCAWWTAQALHALGRRCGMVGTLGVGEPPLDLAPTGLTTPDPVTLQAAFRRFADAGFAACAIEASSIGLTEHRLDGTRIAVAMFTNFTRDHLDYHGSMTEYWAAKRALFSWPGLKAAVVNIDDAHGADLAHELERAALDLWTISAGNGAAQPARLTARNVRHIDGTLAFEVHEGATAVSLHSAMVGEFNVHNLLVVLGGLRALGLSLADAVATVPGLAPVPGRMQRVSAGTGPQVVVDYAHTPDALEKALLSLQPLASARGGALWCVFGCGGNRDASKRPQMGAIAARMAQRVVVTSDNPRNEAPQAIVDQILAGVGGARVHVEIDRREAIAHALREAADADVVLIAGKGHEAVQEIGGVKLPFSDADEARLALARRGPGAGAGRDAMPAGAPASGETMTTLADAHTLLPGARLVGDGATVFRRVHSDTRTLRAGDLFVALRGERFDAREFLPQARAAGAVAALAEGGLEEAGLPGLQVDDALAALQTLAAGWRRRFALPLIAVTGSNGKTTVTQMIAAILRAWMGPSAFATVGNFNNHIGLPLTLLRLRNDARTQHRAGVVELGMNHAGEIAGLARIAAPTVALVNNAQREHQEFMASVEAVALENGAVIEALGQDGTAVFPADDAQVAVWRCQAGARRTLTFALQGPADVTAQASWQAQGYWQVALQTPAGMATVRLRVAGLHNVKNALAATAGALAAGAPLRAVVEGLEAFEPVKGRSQIGSLWLHGRSVALVDDSYNANPDSVLAAIDVLAGLEAPRWLVLGDMGEVGTQGPAFHVEVGRRAHERGIEHLWCAGALCAYAADAYGAGAKHFGSTTDLIDHLGQAPAAHAVLVKGSRFMAMERVVAALQAGAHRHDA